MMNALTTETTIDVPLSTEIESIPTKMKRLRKIAQTKDVVPWLKAGGRGGFGSGIETTLLQPGDGERHRTDTDQEFAEPVALSSTPPARSPLPRTAARWSFDLLAPRARRMSDTMAS